MRQVTIDRFFFFLKKERILQYCVCISVYERERGDREEEREERKEETKKKKEEEREERSKKKEVSNSGGWILGCFVCFRIGLVFGGLSPYS